MALLPDTNTGDLGTTAFSVGVEPNKTYKMLVDDDTVTGNISQELEAVQQAAYKILNTERYKHIIYSWNYGVELADLFGKPMPYVLPEIPRRITEGLMQDDRITAVTDFDLSYDKQGNVLCKFKVSTIYGEFIAERAVKINV